MSHVIRIDREVWEILQTIARPLRDNPNMVLRRLMGLDPLLEDDDFEQLYGLRLDVESLAHRLERARDRAAPAMRAATRLKDQEDGR